MEPIKTTDNEKTSPTPEVLEKPVRRTYTMEEKTRILDEADACTVPGQLGELLRREGIYSSYLNTWRKQREQGALAGLTPKRRGRKRKLKNPMSLTARLKQHPSPMTG